MFPRLMNAFHQVAKYGHISLKQDGL